MRRPLAILLALLSCAPLAALLLLSVAVPTAWPHLWPVETDLQAWRQLSAPSAGLLPSLGLSLAVSLLVASVATAAGFLTAKSFQRHPLRPWLLGLAHLPFILSPVLVGTCLLHLFILLRLSGSIAGVIAAQLIVATSFATVLFSGFWNERTLAIENLVHTLGGTPWQTLTRALVPLARGHLLVCFAQTFLIAWFDYGLSAIIGGGRYQSLTIRVLTYLGEANIPLAALAALLLALPPSLLFALNQRILWAAGANLRLN